MLPAVDTLWHHGCVTPLYYNFLWQQTATFQKPMCLHQRLNPSVHPEYFS